MKSKPKTPKKVSRKGPGAATPVKSLSQNAKGPYAKGTASYQQNSDSVKVTKGMRGKKK